MPKQDRSRQTFETIVRGAAIAFDRYGYGTATLGDVTACAGISKGALYFHFQSKEELARAVIERQHRLSMESARTLSERGDPALATVIHLSHLFAKQLIEEPTVRAGVRLTLESGGFQAEVPGPYQDWIDSVEHLLVRAADEGDLRSGTPAPVLARFIISAFTGVQLVSQVLAQHQDLYTRVQDMWEVLLPSLVSSRKLAHFRTVAASARERASSG